MCGVNGGVCLLVAHGVLSDRAVSPGLSTGLPGTTSALDEPGRTLGRHDPSQPVVERALRVGAVVTSFDETVDGKLHDVPCDLEANLGFEASEDDDEGLDDAAVDDPGVGKVRCLGPTLAFPCGVERQAFLPGPTHGIEKESFTVRADGPLRF